jgi:hypothetical protein
VKFGEMRKIVFARNNNALAGVIEALLLVALVAIVLSTIQLYYVPEIMKQKEADHMDIVENQYATLKSTIETQAIMGIMQADQPIAYSTMSSPITLGNDKLPYFISSWAYGYVEITDKDTAGTDKIDLLPKPADFLNGIPLTSILYEATNAYFVDQSYILEAGGIILKQDEGEAMRVPPPINAQNLSGSIKIYYTIPLLVSKPGKYQSPHSIDTTYVLTNYSKKYSHSDEGLSWIRIYSDYLEAWNESLIHNDDGILWEYHDNGYINVGYDDPVSPTRIEITPDTKDIDVELTIVEINAQIGPGFVID